MAWNVVYTHLTYLALTSNETLSYTAYGLFCAVFTTNALLGMWFKFYYNSYFKVGGINKYEKHKLSIASKKMSVGSKLSMARAG